MNKEVKKKILIAGIILIVIVNMSALASMYYSRQVQFKKMEEQNRLMEEAHKQGMHKFLRSELKLTDEQFLEFKDINHTYFKKTRSIARKLAEKRYEMMNEISKKNPNSAKLDKIAESIGNLHYDLKKVTIEHFLELKGICTEEQQVVLQKMFMHMIYDQDTGNRMRRHQDERRGKRRYKGGRK